MTQDLKYQEASRAVERGVELWRMYAGTYRNMLTQYEFLLEQKRQLKKMNEPLRKIPKEVLDEFPEIPLFWMMSEREVREYLETLGLKRLFTTVKTIEYTLECNHSYRSVASAIADMEWWLRNREKPSIYCPVNAKRCRPTFTKAGSHARYELLLY